MTANNYELDRELFDPPTERAVLGSRAGTAKPDYIRMLADARREAHALGSPGSIGNWEDLRDVVPRVDTLYDEMMRRVDHGEDHLDRAHRLVNDPRPRRRNS